MVHQAPRH